MGRPTILPQACENDEKRRFPFGSRHALRGVDVGKILKDARVGNTLRDAGVGGVGTSTGKRGRLGGASLPVKSLREESLPVESLSEDVMHEDVIPEGPIPEKVCEPLRVGTALRAVRDESAMIDSSMFRDEPAMVDSSMARGKSAAFNSSMFCDEPATVGPSMFRDEHKIVDSSMIKRSKAAFSLIELIVVIAVMAVIAAVIIPSVSGTREAAEEQSAISAAGTLNLAQVQYRLENGTAGWSGKDDATRYGLIQAYMEYNESWTAFQARYPKYSFAFQNLDANGKMVKVVLTKKTGGATVSY